MSELTRLILRRILFAVGALLGASVLIFIGTNILPGDVAQAILGQSATPEALANLRRDLGLNEPAVTRYFNWLFSLLQGDLGHSLTNQQSINDMLGGRLANTFFLAAVVAVITVPLALLLGLIAARYHDKLPDKILSFTTLAAISLPEFFIAYIFLLFFAVQLGWLPGLAKISPQMNFWQQLHAVLLPASTLTFVVLAHMMRMTRAAVLNVMSAPYIETARLKGASLRSVIFRHALPNAIAPIVNVIVLNLAYLVVGVVVVEVIFVYPGLGQLMVDHVSKRDIPVVQACGLIFAATYILLNMAADIIAVANDPKLRYPRT
ncbi:MAG: ABC transporter permease [Proteobacteria bacterium]|nr:ABC transporter permease [Pseudomonadota bacterium]MCH9758379.1 ABC transporter permease [Pseudomonadota bacterium]